jgi:hypothetical protein
MLLKILFDYLFPVREGMQNIGKMITRSLSKPFKAISGGILKIFKSIEKMGKFLGAVFVSIGSYLECGAFYVGNIFSYCIIYYFLYIIGLILYSPFAVLFWATKTQYIETGIWDILKALDEFMKDVSGVAVTDFLFPNKCYKCNLKPMPKHL